MLYVFHVVEKDWKYMMLAVTDRHTAFANKAIMRIKSPDAYKVVVSWDLLHVQNAYVKSLQHTFVMSEQQVARNVFFINKPSIVVSIKPCTLEQMIEILDSDDTHVSYEASNKILPLIKDMWLTWITNKIVSCLHN